MMKHVLSKTLLSVMLFTGGIIYAHCAAPCSNVDLTITKITFTSISSGGYNYDYEIKNIGTASITVSELALQNNVSTDEEGSTTQAAGGSDIDQSNTNTIAPGATFTGSMSASPTCCGGTGTSDYPYLIVSVSSYPTVECNTANNSITVKIEMPVTTGLQSSHVADASVNWNNDTKSFTVKSWSGNSAANLHYTVITSSGVQVFAGNTAEDQSVPLQGLHNGMYIIYLSDGDSVYSKKIIY